MELIGISKINLGVEIYKKDDFLSKVAEPSDADFNQCPVCGSKDIAFGKCEPDSVIIYRVHKCNKCGTSWEERYDLVKVKINK